MSIKSLIKSGCIAMAATCLLMGTAIAANETPPKVTSSTPEGVTYGVDQKYKAPPAVMPISRLRLDVLHSLF